MGSTLASGLFFLGQEYTTQHKKMTDPLMESIDSVGNVPVRVVVIDKGLEDHLWKISIRLGLEHLYLRENARATEQQTKKQAQNGFASAKPLLVSTNALLRAESAFALTNALQFHDGVHALVIASAWDFTIVGEVFAVIVIGGRG